MKEKNNFFNKLNRIFREDGWPKNADEYCWAQAWTPKNIGNENTIPLQNFGMALAFEVFPDLVIAKKKLQIV
jgi:hypothetical protein